MKVQPKIFFTDFSHSLPIANSNYGLLKDKTRDFMLSQGVKLLQRNETSAIVIKFKTHFLQHLFYNPFLLSNRISIKFEKVNANLLDESLITINYRIVHPVPVALTFLFIVIDLLVMNYTMMYISLILFLAYQFFIVLMQVSIFKNLIRNLE